jgi:hypothetical protein
MFAAEQAAKAGTGAKQVVSGAASAWSKLSPELRAALSSGLTYGTLSGATVYATSPDDERRLAKALASGGLGGAFAGLGAYEIRQLSQKELSALEKSLEDIGSELYHQPGAFGNKRGLATAIRNAHARAATNAAEELSKLRARQHEVAFRFGRPKDVSLADYISSMRENPIFSDIQRGSEDSIHQFKEILRRGMSEMPVKATQTDDTVTKFIEALRAQYPNLKDRQLLGMLHPDMLRQQQRGFVLDEELARKAYEQLSKKKTAPTAGYGGNVFENALYEEGRAIREARRKLLEEIKAAKGQTFVNPFEYFKKYEDTL